MGLIHINIERVVVRDNNEEVIKLLKEIKAAIANSGDERVKQLEAQMDGWLSTLRQSVDKVKEVSDRVDSTK